VCVLFETLPRTAASLTTWKCCALALRAASDVMDASCEHVAAGVDVLMIGTGEYTTG